MQDFDLTFVLFCGCFCVGFMILTTGRCSCLISCLNAGPSVVDSSDSSDSVSLSSSSSFSSESTSLSSSSRSLFILLRGLTSSSSSLRLSFCVLDGVLCLISLLSSSFFSLENCLKKETLFLAFSGEGSLLPRLKLFAGDSISSFVSSETSPFV